MSLRSAPVLTLAIAVLFGTAVARADEDHILRSLRDFFETEQPARRTQLAREIQSDSAYRREHLRDWLHRGVSFPALEPGLRSIDVPLAGSATRHVVLRVPACYDPARPWPLIYALHGTGGRGEDVIAYLEHLPGLDTDQYVIAAPTGYGEVAIHDQFPPTMEHPAMLAALRRTAHVDSDRVFVTGYSRGGHATWTLAVLHADQFAGALPLAGTLVLPEIDKLWEVFLPNLSALPLLCVWGANDTAAGDGSEVSPEGGIAGLNRRLVALAEAARLSIVGVELPDTGHGDVRPPPAELRELLSRRRTRYPTEVHHTFRHVYQAQAYWLEGHAWTGPQWGEKLPPVRLNENEDPGRPQDVRQALLRTYRGSLGELRGKIDGQTIDVRRNKLSELTIWIGDDMIDWSQTVTVKVSGQKVFEDKLAPDLLVCLTQAARTYDFERLRWAGLRYKSGSKTRRVTGETEFSSPVGP